MRAAGRVAVPPEQEAAEYARQLRGRRVTPSMGGVELAAGWVVDAKVIEDGVAVWVTLEAGADEKE